MINKAIINTEKAPTAIGTYSQAIKVNNTVYLSGQIALDPKTMELVRGGIECEINQVFDNLAAVCQAAGGDLKNIVKLNIYLVDLSYFAIVNTIMAKYFENPYPARAVIGINELPKAASIEMDAIMVI
ncbi:MAG: reactive intermediate/imine deaminase [Porticoccus sp.]|mgnify:CR=1 FL=1|jgi:reactive intermediate/imine deaminase|nr:reactive intermediate/imine deaminase [Porticoccus sp.]